MQETTRSLSTIFTTRGYGISSDYNCFGIRYRVVEEGRPDLLEIKEKDGSVMEYTAFPETFDEALPINDEVISRVESRLSDCERILHDRGLEVSKFVELFNDCQKRLGKFEKSFLAQTKLLSLLERGLIDYFDAVKPLKQAFFLESDFALEDFNLENLKKIEWLADVDESRIDEVENFNFAQIKLKKIGVNFDYIKTIAQPYHASKCNWEAMADKLSVYGGRDEIIHQILDERILTWQIKMMQVGYPIDLIMRVDDKNNLNKWNAIVTRAEALAIELPNLDLAATFEIVETYDRRAQWEGFEMGMNPVAAGLRPDPEIVRPAIPRPPATQGYPRTFAVRTPAPRPPATQEEGFAMGMNPTDARLQADSEIVRPVTPRPPRHPAPQGHPGTLVARPAMDGVSLASEALGSPLAPPRPPSSLFRP